MGNCIHFKDGKYRLWSSYSDEFVTKWIDEATLTRILLAESIDDFKFSLEQRLNRAKDQGCSLIPNLIRHKGKEI